MPDPPLSASEIRLRPSSRSRVGSMVSERRSTWDERCVAHPRDRGELHAVGLLVQADPEPEVVGVGARAPARRGRCWGRPAAGGRPGRRTGRTGRAPCRPGSPSTAPISAPVTRDPRALLSAGGRPLLLGDLVDERATAARRSSRRWRGSSPAGRRRGAARWRRSRVRGHQPGVVADQPGGPGRVGTELGDHRVRLRAADLGPGAGQPGPDADREVPVDHLGSGHGFEPTGPGPTEQRQPPIAAAAASSASRAASVLSSGTRSAISTKATDVPSRSVASPARLLVPRRVPVLARTRPRAAGARVGEAVLQRAGEAGDRQPGEQRPAARGARRRPRPAARRAASRARARCRGTARCRRTTGRQPRAPPPARSSSAPDTLHPARERRLADGRQPDLVGQHLRGLVVADVQHPLDDLRRGARSRPPPAAWPRHGPGDAPAGRSRGCRPRRAPRRSTSPPSARGRARGRTRTRAGPRRPTARGSGRRRRRSRSCAPSAG